MTTEAEGLFADIDQHSLDAEWTKHCKRMGKFTKLLADAKNDFTVAKSRQEFVQAELSEAVRNSPDRFKVEGKLTEGRVEAIVLVQPKYQETVVEVNKAKHRQDVLQGVVNTLDHRKKALEDMVALWSQSYFAAPKVPESARTGDFTAKVDRSTLSGRKAK